MITGKEIEKAAHAHIQEQLYGTGTTAEAWGETVLGYDGMLEAIKQISNVHKMGKWPKPKKIGRFERLMNRLGWFRRYEMIVVESDKLNELLRPRPFSFGFSTPPQKARNHECKI